MMKNKRKRLAVILSKYLKGRIDEITDK